VSTIATATVLPLGSLEPLRDAARPKKGLFGGSRDRFHDQLKRHGRELPVFDGQGYVLATLLCFLQERGIDLMKSEHGELAKALASTRGATFFILSDAVKTSHLKALAAASFTNAELRTYYEKFSATDAPGVDRVMVEGVRFLVSALDSAAPDKVVMLEIS
jgi:hypothetical protein